MQRREYRFFAVIAAVIIIGLCVVLFNQQAVSGQEKATSGQSAASAKEVPAQQVGQPWSVRCTSDKPGRECEVYQRLVVAKSGQRVAEFAVGFPKGKQDGRGVIVLPLGILLEDGIVMQIDEGQKFKFKPRYCTSDGCFAFINVSAALVNALEKGNEVHFNAKALNGKEIKIRMSLKGLSKTIKAAAESQSSG
jgi:invasion protein IalB